MPRRFMVIPLALATTAALGACGEQTVKQSEVEQTGVDALSKKVGQQPAGFSCPDDIEAKVDESMRCELTAEDGTRFGVTAKVIAVDGDKARFNFQVDQQPKR